MAEDSKTTLGRVQNYTLEEPKFAPKFAANLEANVGEIYAPRGSQVCIQVCLKLGGKCWHITCTQGKPSLRPSLPQTWRQTLALNVILEGQRLSSSLTPNLNSNFSSNFNSNLKAQSPNCKRVFLTSSGATNQGYLQSKSIKAKAHIQGSKTIRRKNKAIGLIKSEEKKGHSGGSGGGGAEVRVNRDAEHRRWCFNKFNSKTLLHVDSLSCSKTNFH
ncbi:hypothetical protein Ahy_A07g033588 isoform B [Arachis hypogaea]|uniref:Uncharacterized protein n=1 Tax=Arachis hypogaea TaxID=3818 RepID=A0A445C9M1_ARAHY|nr:hypothetical protein Ahy_A07g033588 isoform B [Arachis hypogaea]